MTTTGPAWNYVIKFVITGDAAVGKSSLLVRLTDQRFLVNPDPTLGVEFGSKIISVDTPSGENKVVKLQCWDTAGTESFRSITRSYYRGAAGALVVFDVTQRRSFENVRMWLGDVRAHADPELTCVLVGNKVDLCDNGKPRGVSTAEAQTYADGEGLLYVEASARDGRGVEEAFGSATKEILGKIERGVWDDDRGGPSKAGVRLDARGGGSGTAGASSCC